LEKNQMTQKKLDPVFEANKLTRLLFSPISELRRKGWTEVFKALRVRAYQG
jgi:hypothetical protein